MRRAGQRQRGRVELAELEVGELGARRRGRAPSRRRSRPAGWWSAHHSAAPPPVVSTVAGPAIAPRVGDHAGAALAVAPQRRRAEAPSSTSIALLGGDQLGEPRGDRAPGLAAAGVDDPPRRVAALEPERELAVGIGVEAHAAAACSCSTAAGASRVSTSTALVRQRPRPAAKVSAAWRSGESSAASAAASPPWAQKLELSASGFRETSVVAGARGRGLERDVQPGGAAADHHARLRCCGLGPRAGYGTRGAMAPLPLASLLAPPRHRRPSRERRPPGRDRGRARARAGRRARAVEAPAATREQLAARPRRRARRRDRGVLRRRRRDDRHGHDRRRADSFEAALHAAGGAAAAAERLLAGEAQRGVLRPAPARPPRRARSGDGLLPVQQRRGRGRATRSTPAAPSGCSILDWDVHHGNGTEAIFAAVRDVLYASIHQWPLYPGTGAAEYAGEGEGEGYTVNLPVAAGAGSEEFLALVEHVVAPIARAYEPGLIVISAGYDAHRDDPLASCAVETEAYGEMTAAIRDVARRARGAGAGLPRGRLLAGGAGRVGGRDARRARRRRRAARRPLATPPSRTARRLRERWAL